MNDIDTRLRDTLQRVATTTRTADRVEEIVQHRQRRPIGFIVAAAAFVVVVLLVGIPALLNSPQGPQQQVGSSDEPDVTSTVSVPVVDPAWLTVEAEDLKVFEQLREQGASVFGAGWRPSLRTEDLLCLYSNGTGADTSTSEFPIDQDLTRTVIEAECGTGNDPARNLESPPETFTFCRGVFVDSAYQEWTIAGMTIVEGQLDADRPGFPVVLGWESDCVSEQLDTSTAIQLDAFLSLEAINRARQVEIAVTGASYTNCFTYNQAVALAKAVRRHLGDNWLHTRFSGLDTDVPNGCYQPIVDLQWGAIYVFGQDRPTSTDQTSSTFPPTSTTLPTG